ncbi:MAG: polysaccharide pyruvyl transferase family protein, partial [Clostridia bacterium]|nr:polysaccharide pyruvyl transferase family protein [Clostridia bacterium]
MKILMVLMGLEIGGAETHVAELSAELARRGNEVHIASNGGVYEKEITKFGIIHHKLPLNSKNPKSMMRSYAGLKKIIKKEKFDIVHAHARIPAFICSKLHRKLKFRFITSAHWVFKTSFLLKNLTSWGERSVAVSNDIKNYLIDNYGYSSDKIDITINGIDTEKFSPQTDFSDIKEEFGLEDNKKRIVYVSRMDVDRSAVAFNLLEIAPKLYEKYPDLDIVIVGGGNDYERLLKKTGEVNKIIGYNLVKTTGARTDINKFVASGNLFIGVSRAALEAMSAEKPVIIAGNEGYIGLFDQSKTEISIKTNFCCRGCEMPDNQKLFDDICNVFDNINIDEMSKFNRDYTLQNYSVKKMTDDYEIAYTKLLDKNPFRYNDVLISGYYGFKNTGDDSLLKSIVNNLKSEKSNISITVLSKTPSETSKLYNVNSISRVNIFRIMHIMKHTRLLISGGGSLLQDVTSKKSYKYYSLIIKIALKYKTKVMIYANGIGPLTSKANRRDCKALLNKVNIITLRDDDSFEELNKLGIDNKIKVTADPAFSLKCDESFKTGINKKYFIVSIRKWKSASSDFEEKITSICREINLKYGFIPVFVPLQNSIDLPICKSVSERCGGIVAENFSGAEQL